MASLSLHYAGWDEYLCVPYDHSQQRTMFDVIQWPTSPIVSVCVEDDDGNVYIADYTGTSNVCAGDTIGITLGGWDATKSIVDCFNHFRHTEN